MRFCGIIKKERCGKPYRERRIVIMRRKIMMAGILAMSMVFAACGSGASTEVEQEDTEVIQDETPEAEEEEVTETPEATVTPEETPEALVTAAPDDEEAQKEETVQAIPQDLTPVAAQYQVYEGTYNDMNLNQAMSADGGSNSYCQIEVSNITDQSFDFTVYQLTDGNKKELLDTRTATFVEDGTKAVSEKDGTNLVFTFPDSWNALPKVVEMQVSGLDVLEGNSYINNSVPGYEFG